MARLRRLFEVEKLPGTVVVTKRKFVKAKDGAQKFITEEVEVPAGYMVYFPQGHSIRVFNEAELTRLGLNDKAGYVDMDTGERVDAEDAVSLKDLVASRTQDVRRGEVEVELGD